MPTEVWRRLMLFHSRARTRLANERTLLAWLRTSLALITVGFVVQRFDLLLSQQTAHDLPWMPFLMTWVPLLFFTLGGIIVTLSTWEFFRNQREIHSQNEMRRGRVRDALILTALLFLLAVTVIFVISKP